MGDSVEARGVKTTLNAVRILPTTDADQPIESPDNLFVATDLTFENTSEESVAVSDLYEFTLQNEDGYSASQTTHTQQRPLLAEGEVEPGGKTSGDLVYEVAPESKGLQLDYAPFSGGETYTWRVGDASEIPGSEESTSSKENQTEEELVEAVEDYYQAVDREDWGYTYQNLDSKTRALFSEEEAGFFMPDASFEEFVAAQGGGSPSPSASAASAGEEDAKGVEDAVRGHYEAIGRGDFEEAYSYFGPTMRSRQDEASWVASEQSYEIQSSAIHSLTVDEVLGSTATATVDVSFVDNTGTSRFVIVWGLLKEDGQWKLDEQISAQRASGSSTSLTASATPTASPSPSGGGVPPISEEKCPPSHPVKGNQSGIYHDVDSSYYDATHPEECFATTADAEAAGYRAPKR